MPLVNATGTPLFSIVLPTYNRAYVLWRAILSILHQSVAAWELIVVDDGSTDCTRRLLEELRDERIQVVASPHLGPAGARNRGLQVASAPLVAYLDSDNVWRPDFLRVMGEASRAEEHAVLWYCGQRTTFWERTADGRWAVIESRDHPGRQFRLEDIRDLQFADVNCIVHRRGIMATAGGWDERCSWLEDWDFFARVFHCYPDRVRWVPHILTDYRQVFGGGADGVCGEFRENRHAEVAARRYLRDKWGGQLSRRAIDKLSVAAGDLVSPRAARAAWAVVGR